MGALLQLFAAKVPKKWIGLSTKKQDEPFSAELGRCSHIRRCDCFPYPHYYFTLFSKQANYNTRTISDIFVK
jgi:hypothetical protein